MIVHGDRVFVSNFVHGGIDVFDLSSPAEGSMAFVEGPGEGLLTSWWGLKADPARDRILVAVNAFYGFDGNVAAPCEVRAYDATTAELLGSWTLPEGTVGNSLAVGGDGRYYVGDIGPTARIVRIDPDSDAVDVWKEDAVQWDAAQFGGFGLGGMDWDGQGGFYAVFGGQLWYLPMLEDGMAGELQTVALTSGGQPFGPVQADGMSWAGNGTLYYAQNDAFQPGANGVLYQVDLQGAVQGTVQVVRDALKDPSGVFVAAIDGARYVLVNESQYGHLFQVDEGGPTLPFRVLAIPAPPVRDLPAEIPFTGEVWPEDVIVHGDRVFVSNFVHGGIDVFDLSSPAEGSMAFVEGPGEGLLTSWWGLKADPARDRILVAVNAFYGFDGNVAAPCEVRAYDATTAELLGSWTLPEGTVGNSLAVGGDGRYYVGDIGPTARIVRIDPDSDAVDVWKEDAVQWDAAQFGGFGLGGMDWDGQGGFYAVFGGQLWYLPMLEDGMAGELQTVALTSGGQPFGPVQADGMSWAGNGTLYYAQNDAFQPGANGVLYQVDLQGAVQGTVQVVRDALKDPSGVFVAAIDGARYVLVNESQYGHLFQVDEGGPTLPFRVLVIER